MDRMNRIVPLSCLKRGLLAGDLIHFDMRASRQGEFFSQRRSATCLGRKRRSQGGSSSGDVPETEELKKATDEMWAKLPQNYQWLKDWEYV